MSDVLSQNEIDKLFNALNTGDLDVNDMVNEDSLKMIRNYNFKRPSKFSKEQLRTLESIFENYGRHISTYLSALSGNVVSVESIASEAVTYSEFSNSLSSPVLLSIVNVESSHVHEDAEKTLEGSILIDFSTILGFVLIDRVLGGQGTVLAQKRDFTDIELCIIQKVIKQFVRLLQEPFENIVDLHPMLHKIETNSQVVQIISPNETVALITLKIKMGEVEGMMNICLPYLVLEPIMDKLNTRYWFSNNHNNNLENQNKQIKKTLNQTQVCVQAILGKTSISVKEFLTLRPGDCIKLNNSVKSDLEVYIGDELKYTAKAGTLNHQKAICIKSVIKREEI